MLLALSVLGGHRAESVVVVVVVVVASSTSESTLGSLALCSNTCDSVAGDVFNIFLVTSVIDKLFFGVSVLLLFHARFLLANTLF